MKSDNYKYLRDQITNLVKWQVGWYFVLLGFSMVDHSYFEVQNRDIQFYSVLEQKLDSLESTLKVDAIELAKHKIVKTRFNHEKMKAKEDAKEAYFRAVGLILLAIFLSGFFPYSIFTIYKKIDSLSYVDEMITLAPKTPILIGTVFLSFNTLGIAILVAFL